MKKAYFILIAFLLSGLMSYAEDLAPKLTDEEKQEFTQKIQQKIQDFQTHLGVISSAKSTPETINIAVEECLKLFLGKGDKYVTYDAYENAIDNDPVTIQITSKRRPNKPNTRYVKAYLNSLATSLQRTYTKVNITSYDAVRVDNLHEIGDGKYECVAYFFQKFEGYRDGRLIYVDYTAKRVRVILEQVEGHLGKTWAIALGDISAVSTH